MVFIDKAVKNIKDAKTDDQIKDVLMNVYVSTQIDSKIREEFDEYFSRSQI